MKQVTVFCVSFAYLLLAAAAAAASDGSVSPTPREVALAAQARPGPALQQETARRLAQAAPVRMVAPLWHVGPSTSSDLYVINTFSEAVDTEVSVLDPRGRVVGTAFLTVETARHRVLSIASLVGSSPVGGLSQGSLRLEFVGDADMLQAWVVRSDSGGVTELALKKVSADSERELTSFWDLRRTPSRSGEEVRFWLVNGGVEALPYRVEAGRPGTLGRVLEASVLQPGEQRVWEPRGAGISSTHGVVTFVNEGTPGALAVAGLIEGRRAVANLPIVTPEMRALRPEYDAVRVPFFSAVRAGLGEAVVTVVNMADRTQSVAVQVVAARDGVDLLGAGRFEVRSGEVRSVDLGSLLNLQEVLSPEGAHVVIRGELPGLLVSGLASSYLTGETTELSFFPREKVHPSGSYPVPDPKRFDVSTTLVNLGTEESRIVGQVSWDGGTYSIGPVVIPGRGSHTVDFRRLAALGDKDLAERTLPSSFSGGFFHWTVQGGGTELIARTEASPQGGRDAFGFNCFGCCFEMSRGAVLPGSTTFAAGTSSPFEGVEFIDTSCSGTMGPYTPYSPTLSYGAPFSWNGTTVSASGPATQSLSFSAPGHRTTIQLPCSEIPITIFGAGPATATKVTILGVSLPNNQVQVRLEPASMSGTLEVKLTGGSQRVLVNTTYASGDHTIGFGNLSSYSAGQEFSQVKATWTVNGKAATATYNYHFKALGTFNHTRYNTPNESLCSGTTKSPLCHLTGGCKVVSSCTSGWSTNQALSGWLSEAFENGSGFHSTLGYMSREWECEGSAPCARHMRKVPQPCPFCDGMPVTPGQTVAVHESRQRADLPCGTQVFVDGVGVVTVTDVGGLLTTNQLDHYAGTSGCNRTAGTIGMRPTFKLF